MKLKKLTIENFRVFKNRTSVEFPENGLTLITGYNSDTKVSHASGKSSFLLAIGYALGISPVPATRLKNWYSADSKPFVELEFDLGGVVHKLTRGEQVVLKFGAVDGKTETIRGATGVNEYLAAKLPLGAIEKVFIRNQRKRSAFLTLGDQQKKEFLGEVLGLTQIENSLATSKTNELETEKKLVPLRALVTAKEDQLQYIVVEAPLLIRTSEIEREIKSLLAKRLQLESERETLNRLRGKLEDTRDSDLFAIQQDEAVARAKVENEFSPKIAQAKLLRDTVKDSEKELIAAKSKLQTLKIQFLDELQHHEGEIKSLRFQRDNLTQKLNQYKTEREIQRSKLVDEDKTLKAEYEGMKSNRCYVCKRDFLEFDSTRMFEIEKRVNELEAKLLELKQPALTEILTKQRLESLVDPPQPIEPESLKSAQEEVNRLTFASQNEKGLKQQEVIQLENQLTTEILKIANNSNKAKAQVEQTFKTRLVSEFTPNEIQLNRSLSTLQKDLFALEKQLAEAKVKNTTAEREYLTAKNNRSRATKEIDQLKTQIKALEETLNAELDFQTLQKSYLGAIFDEVLQEIENTINEKLTQVSIMSEFVISVNSTSETQKGEKRQKINFTITSQGNTFDPEDLSGAQKSLLEIVVDTALSEILCRRLTNAPAWVILDEALEGVSNDAKEPILDYLGALAVNRLVLVVDHSTEVNEHFTQTIRIVRDQDSSRFLT